MDTEKNINATAAASPDLVSAPDSAAAPEPTKSAAPPAEAKPAQPELPLKAEQAAVVEAAPEVRVEAAAVDHPTADATSTRAAWRSNRFALLAATIAIAAGFGSMVGAAGYSGAAHLMAAPPPHAPAPQIVRVDNAAEIKTLRETTAQLRAGFKQLSDNINALKASLDGAGKAGGPQLAKITETVSRLSENVDRQERGHAETAQRIAKTADALDKLERRANAMMNASPDVTGSTTAVPKGRVADAKPANAKPANAPPPPGPPIVEGWNLRRVMGDGLAIVEGPDRVIEIEVGDTIRGVGRVHDIKKMDGRWAIVTARGLIVSPR